MKAKKKINKKCGKNGIYSRDERGIFFPSGGVQEATEIQ